MPILNEILLPYTLEAAAKKINLSKEEKYSVRTHGSDVDPVSEPLKNFKILWDNPEQPHLGGFSVERLAEGFAGVEDA